VFHPKKRSQLKSCKVTAKGGQIVKAHHESYLMAADSKQEMEDWVAAIQTNLFCLSLDEIQRQREMTRCDSSSDDEDEDSAER